MSGIDFLPININRCILIKDTVAFIRTYEYFRTFKVAIPENMKALVHGIDDEFREAVKNYKNGIYSYRSFIYRDSRPWSNDKSEYIVVKIEDDTNWEDGVLKGSFCLVIDHSNFYFDEKNEQIIGRAIFNCFHLKRKLKFPYNQSTGID